MTARLLPLLLSGAIASTSAFGDILQMNDFALPTDLQFDSELSTVSMDNNGNISSNLALPTSLQVDNSIALDLPTQNLTGFTINVNYIGTPPPASQQAAFTDAANAWMSRITGYRGVMSLPSVTINAEVSPIDGAGGTLGSAGPTFASIQDEDGLAGGLRFTLTTEGDMTFDSADIDNLETAGSLGAVIEHEMGHVLGIGTLWNTASFGGSFAGTQALYTDGSGQFTGAAAIAQWQSEFGQADAFVPVELGGGAGTANGHWNEVDDGAGPTGITQIGTDNDMRDELMTGWLNPDSFVSQMTLASLYDIGYTVVPEPSTGLLAVIGGLLTISRRRR